MIKATSQFIIAVVIILNSTALLAQHNTAALIPMPNKVEQKDSGKPFKIDKAAIIKCDTPDSIFIKNLIKQTIKNRTGILLPEKESGREITIIHTPTTHNNESYTLDINHKQIRIEGGQAGIFYAVQTLDQILLGDKRNTEKGLISPIHIEDQPRYNRRAVMLDPSRHFLPLEDVKFFIDQMAKFKYNVLQLHLTDDQGWRIEIKSHPKLTQTGAFRNKKGGSNGPDNGFYTQEQMKELIQYASERYIEIVPELDIPGHSVAILAAYPQLGCSFRQSEEKNLGSTTNMMLCASCNDVYTVYEDIIREVASIFPSKYIHLGGDEAAVKANWAKCEDCLATMHKAGYNEPSQLMNIFFGKMLDIVKRNKKEAILWCELDNIWPPANDYLFPYPTDVTLVTWRNGLTPKCIELTRKHGNNLIMAPGEYTYLDYPQWKNDLPEYNNWGMPVTTLETCYKFDPGYGLSPEESSHITGVMATLWAEAIKDINRVNYMFFPRGLAIAEAAWSTMEQRSWESFKERLQPNLSDLMKCGVSYRVPFEIYERK